MDGDDVELGHEILAAAAGEQDVAGVGGPVEDVIVRGVEGELFGLASFRGDDVDVEIAVAVTGEGDPLAVRGEARVDIARGVGGDALDVGAGVVGGPDVTEVGEGDAALVVAGVADQFGFTGVADGGGADDERKGGNSGREHSLVARLWRGAGGYRGGPATLENVR